MVSIHFSFHLFHFAFGLEIFVLMWDFFFNLENTFLWPEAWANRFNVESRGDIQAMIFKLTINHGNTSETEKASWNVCLRQKLKWQDIKWKHFHTLLQTHNLTKLKCTICLQSILTYMTRITTLDYSNFHAWFWSLFQWGKEKKWKKKIGNSYTVMFAWTSYFSPFFPINRHVSSSTVAESIWNLLCILGNAVSRTRMSSFNLARQAICQIFMNYFPNSEDIRHHQNNQETIMVSASQFAHAPRKLCHRKKVAILTYGKPI